jgi:hypothetical protein
MVLHIKRATGGGKKRTQNVFVLGKLKPATPNCVWMKTLNNTEFMYTYVAL